MPEPGQRLVSLELERMMMHAGQGSGAPQAADPRAFREVLACLADHGWVGDPWPGDHTDRVILPAAQLPADQCWSCTCDVTTSLFETALSPTASLHHLSRQQRELDATLWPVLASCDLTLLQLETQPAVMPTRQLFARTSASWRQPYRARAERGEDTYWASWIAASTPCIDVTVQEAMRATRVMHHLTPVALLMSRSGPVVGGKRSPGGRLTIRPWAHQRVFAGSPHAADLRRVTLPVPELRTWHDYFRYLLTLPTLVLIDPGGRAARIPGDPPFISLWDRSDSGVTIRHLEQVQRHVFFTRPRWLLGPGARIGAFREAYRRGEKALTDYLDEHLTRLYLELRPDSPAPPGEDLCMLALWLGLLEDLDATEALVDRQPAGFWASLMDVAQFAPFASRLGGRWLPDLVADILDIAVRSLDRRGAGEGYFLRPIADRISRASTPAEDILRLVTAAGNPAAAVDQIVARYAWRPAAAALGRSG
jgi:hypothetical protein